MVEANRIGTIIARSTKAAAQWDARKAMANRGGSGLTGASLDKAVSMIAMRTRGAHYPGGRQANNVRTERVN